MAAIPSIEAHLVQLHKCLALPQSEMRIKTEDRHAFSDLGLSLKKHADFVQHFLDDLLASLDLEAEASAYALRHFLDWANFYKSVQLRTWTRQASAQQVIWHLAGHVHAPFLGRSLAFWAMDDALGQGMPGGRFWFLPTLNAVTGKVEEPVANVLDWLLNLYATPIRSLRAGLGAGAASLNDKADSFERNLYNWRTVSPYPKTISEMFPDEFDCNSDVVFRGTFAPEPQASLPERAAAARAFVQAKGMNAELLRDEIPMVGEGRIESVLNADASPDETEHFVLLLSQRYGRPSARTIRQRFGVARMCQEAYRALSQFLQVKGSAQEGDPSRNKVLQLTAILSRCYNLTIEAREKCGHLGEDAENRYFESMLAPWEALGPFIGLLHSRKAHAADDVASLLCRIFSNLTAEDGLRDMLPFAPKQFARFVLDTMQNTQTEVAEVERAKALKKRVQKSSPFRALQEETDFKAVQQLALDVDLGERARLMGARRLAELAATPDEVVQAGLAELGVLIDCTIKHRTPDVGSRVPQLIESLNAQVAASGWKAPLLSFEAKHLLALNDWPKALAKFREALDACSERSFGPLRGEIARDGWAVALAMGRFQVDQENFYRNMLDYGAIEAKNATNVTMEDTALLVADYFWSDLYKPYAELARKPQSLQVQAGGALEDAARLILKDDQEGLNSWLTKHQRTLARAHLKDVRGGTVLTLWLKISNDVRFLEVRPKWISAIERLIEMWPAQAGIADFKGQSPLMLAADAGLDNLVIRLLDCPGASLDAQDYIGRTALHAAVTGGNLACLEMMLDRQPDMTKVTQGEAQTVLHTAARLGRREMASRILDAYPFLSGLKNVHGRTPVEECAWSLDDYDVYSETLASHGRSPASRETLRSVLAVLNTAA